MNKERVFYEKDKGSYLSEIIIDIITLRNLRNLLSLFAYYTVNFSIGRHKAKVGKGTKLHPTVVLRQPERIEIGKGCMINHGDVLQAGKKDAVIKIGNFVQLGPNVMMFAYNHAYDDITRPSIKQGYYDGDIIIEDDATISAGSIIMAGVTVGKGSVIGAGSVVRKSIPPYAIATGNPAKIVGFRFSPEDLEEYEKYNLPEEERLSIVKYRKMYAKYFYDRTEEIGEFLKI